MRNKKTLLWTLFVLSLSLGACSNVDFATTNTPKAQVDGVLQDIITKCNTGTLVTQEFMLSFPKPTVTCPWNVNGNLEPRNGYFQARIEDPETIQLPAGSTVCNMTFEHQTQDFRYDDHFTLLLNNIVMASSYKVSHVFQSSQQLYIYDWMKFRGLFWVNPQHHAIYCAGSAEGLSTCSFPGHDEQGHVSLAYDPLIFHRIMSMDPNRTAHTFTVVGIGDNDEWDCEHSDLNFKVKVTYAK
jgi:hypothetical protein